MSKFILYQDNKQALSKSPQRLDLIPTLGFLASNKVSKEIKIDANAQQCQIVLEKVGTKKPYFILKNPSEFSSNPQSI